jgi:hypothetical protein
MNIPNAVVIVNRPILGWHPAELNGVVALIAELFHTHRNQRVVRHAMGQVLINAVTGKVGTSPQSGFHKPSSYKRSKPIGTLITPSPFCTSLWKSSSISAGLTPCLIRRFSICRLSGVVNDTGPLYTTHSPVFVRYKCHVVLMV